MDLTKKILNILLVIVTIIAVLMTSLLIYFTNFGQQYVPSGVTSTYTTTVTDPITKEELPVLEANYYSNKNKNGYEVLELKINAYSGVGQLGIYSRGFQLVWDEYGNVAWNIQDNQPLTKVFYYDTINTTSFVTGNRYEWGDKFIVDIDGKIYGLALDGQYIVNVSHIKPFPFLNLIFTGSSHYYVPHVVNYSFEDLLNSIKTIILSCSEGTGDSVISLVDLGDFLHIYNYDDSTGQFSGEPIGENDSNNTVNSYFTMKLHFDNNGMVYSKQSLFGSVAGESDFNISEFSEEVDYWKCVTKYDIDKNDFELRYSETEDGYYYYLPTSTINELKSYENLEIYVTINLEDKDYKILGIDYYGLYGIKIKSLEITSSYEKSFKLMQYSLKDTGIRLSDIVIQNVELINLDSGVID